MDRPDVLILSSSKTYPIAEGVRENLKEHFEVTLWREGFFSQNNVAPLNEFLKKLVYFDIAVLIMGPDDLRSDSEDPAKQVFVPRDNVIFELGATMARFGTHKTFMLVPDGQEVVLPTYFKGLSTLTYESRKDNNLQAATGGACVYIRNEVQRLAGRIFHSDLPAIGLTFGYFYNFIKPIFSSLRRPQSINTGAGKAKWVPKDGYTLTVMIPNAFMSRRQADKFCTSDIDTENVQVLLDNGRDVSVYVLDRPEPGLPLHIIDIPTTLFTSMRVIKRVDAYWGPGDREYTSRLEKREIASFRRNLTEIIIDDDFMTEDDVSIIPQNDIHAHIRRLTE